MSRSFSALQRAEIAEIGNDDTTATAANRFSALQRAEIAEITASAAVSSEQQAFQCSSTSRNC